MGDGISAGRYIGPTIIRAETQDKASEETPESAQADTESAAVTIREYEAIAYRQKLRIIYPTKQTARQSRRRLGL